MQNVALDWIKDAEFVASKFVFKNGMLYSRDTGKVIKRPDRFVAVDGKLYFIEEIVSILWALRYGFTLDNAFYFAIQQAKRMHTERKLIAKKPKANHKRKLDQAKQEALRLEREYRRSLKCEPSC